MSQSLRYSKVPSGATCYSNHRSLKNTFHEGDIHVRKAHHSESEKNLGRCSFMSRWDEFRGEWDIRYRTGRKGERGGGVGYEYKGLLWDE